MLWSTCHIQYGPGKSVHLEYLYADFAESSYQHQYGWPWQIARQRSIGSVNDHLIRCSFVVLIFGRSIDLSGNGENKSRSQLFDIYGDYADTLWELP